MVPNLWVVIVQAITPLILLFSLWVQKQWADKAAKMVTGVKQDLKKSDEKTESNLGDIKQIAVQTHTLVNSQRGVILKNMAILSRNHAIMARKSSNLSNNTVDREIADRAEAAADAAESDFNLHQAQQDIVDQNRK